ncbi:FixH family protein [Carboxylicivirga linearis]|uniref:FixH family protein n=1 Tax=Carboxylicivirga linearis TaxID=1628157 RepID=A0ABS5JRI4_9BACT|nr:FixH family protein [Carboxylicivirga linearis]MBS2097433.1 FixH family protein [Carboxylicivirga linearis]
MKFNWGHGLFVVIILGITGFLTLVFITTQERIDMVTDEYYPKELKYQKQIEKTKNYNALTQKIELKVNGDLAVVFPKLTDKPEGITGNIHIYRPSDKRLDLQKEIQLDTTFTTMFNKSALQSGKYEVIIEWQANNQPYFAKMPLYID